MRHATLLALAGLMAGGLLAAQSAGAAGPKVLEPAAADNDVVIRTLPGIVIDTKAREVRLEGKVCLESGALELFVCGEGTREHESVIVVKARPSHVTYALALLGLDPGRPGYRTEGGAFSAPAGAVLDITARFPVETSKQGNAVKEVHEVPAWKLLRLADTKGALSRPIRWVYVGRPGVQALQAADREGTVVCLSNFVTAVIDVPFESTDVNANLVYEANPETVPPVGTPVELVIKPTGKRIQPKKIEIEVIVKKDGSLLLDGEPIEQAALRDTVNAMPARIRTTVLRAEPDVPFGRVIDVRDILRNALMKVTLKVLRPEAAQASGAGPAPLRLTVTAADKVRVGEELLTLEAFRKRAADLLRDVGRVALVVEPEASWKTVAEVMAVAREHDVAVTLSRGG